MVKSGLVELIEFNKAGKTINLVRIDLIGHEPILRNAKVFLMDLQKSAVAGIPNLRMFKGVPSSSPIYTKLMYSQAVLYAMRDMYGATILGDISHHKAGDKWTVTEDSRMITDKNHPLFGTVEVGDQQEYQSDGTSVGNGFLNIRFPEVVLARQANASAKAAMEAMLMDAMDDLGGDDDDNDGFDSNDYGTPTGTGTPKPVVEEVFNPEVIPNKTAQ